MKQSKTYNKILNVLNNKKTKKIKIIIIIKQLNLIKTITCGIKNTCTIVTLKLIEAKRYIMTKYFMSPLQSLPLFYKLLIILLLIIFKFSFPFKLFF